MVPAGPLRTEPTPARSGIEPFVAEGTGEFVSQSTGFENVPTAAGQDGVTLNLLNAPIAHAAKVVLGDILKVNYTVSEKVSGTVTVQTTAPVPRSALIDLFESMLKVNNAALVRGEGFYQIVPAANLAESGLSLSRDGQRPGIGTEVRIIPLRHISASEAKKLVEPVSPHGAVLRADDQRNLLVIAGTQRELANVTGMMSAFDVDWLKGMSFALFPLNGSDPESIAKELETVFGLDREGPLKGTLRFVPNKRLGAILLITTNPAHIDTARSWIGKLDRLAQSSEEQLFVYKIQNRPAGELATLLSWALSPKAHRETSAAGDIAPSYEPTTLSSSPPNATPAQQGEPEGGWRVTSNSTASMAGSATGTAQRFEAASSEAPVAGEASQTGSKVRADEANNALLIRATPRDYPRVLKILESLDRQPTQVMLEAMIVEVTLNDELKFGLKWFLEKHNSSFTLSDAVSGAVASSFPGFSYFFSAGNVRLALDAVSGVTDVNVVSAPSLMVLDNHKAVLQVGDQVPIVTQSAQNVVTSEGGPIINSVAFRDTGVILSVTPRVNDAGRVVLEIEQEVSNVARTTSSGIDSPTIQQRRVKTSVAVGDGEVLALGGLIQERDNTSKTQVPILGNIPILGAAFRQKTDKIDRTELLIFIRPMVARDSGEAGAITEEFQKRIKIEAPASQRGRNQYDRDAGRILR